MLHLDAHPDTSETTFGERISNATPFRRAVEEGLLDCKRVVQIGLRGTGNSPVDYEFGRSHVSSLLLSSRKFCFYVQCIDEESSTGPLLSSTHDNIGQLKFHFSSRPARETDANSSPTFGVKSCETSGEIMRFVSSMQGFKIVPAKYCWYKSMEPLMAQVRELMGDAPVFISFDIDVIDPGYAPGTGQYL